MNELVGVLVDLPVDRLAIAGEIAADLSRGPGRVEVEVLIGPRNRSRGDVWLLLDAAAAGAGAERTRARAAFGAIESSEVVSFRAVPINVRGDDVDRRATLTMPVAFAPPAGSLAELDRFYETEHTPSLLKIPGWLRVRRFELTEVERADWTRLALHDLVGLEVFDDPVFARAAETEWYRRLMKLDWFSQAGRRPLGNAAMGIDAEER